MMLAGRRALVTGAGSHGIGRAIALALAEAGCDVAVHHLGQAATAEALARTIAEAGRHACCLEADLADPAAARALVTRATRQLGSLEIVVNCAATLARVPLLEITDDEWDRVHGVNLRGYFAVSQEAARHMVAGGEGGRIIMVSSVNQHHPTPGLAHYVASKGGVMMLARAMALELAEHGITVNLIAPGTVRTDLNRASFDDAAFTRAKLALIPMRRIAEPVDVAGAAVFLASDAASYITGSTITIDGGLTLQ
jgi:NAD(P)-dependent dehydrogenase (short-subunit alcohol dehydrogenase family)